MAVRKHTIIVGKEATLPAPVDTHDITARKKDIVYHSKSQHQHTKSYSTKRTPAIMLKSMKYVEREEEISLAMYCFEDNKHVI